MPASSSAQYVIDVAARLSGGDVFAAQLDAAASQLADAGIHAAQFEDAAALLSSSLQRQQAVVASAASALAEGRAQYSELESAAQRAARTAEAAAAQRVAANQRVAQSAARLATLQAAAERAAATATTASQQRVAEQRQMAADRARAVLARLQAAAARAAAAEERTAAASRAAAAALGPYAREVDALRAASDAATEEQRRLATQLSRVNQVSARVRDQLGDATTDLSTFRGALGDVGGPLGEFGERLLYPAQALVDLRERFGTMTAALTVGVVGIAAVAAALLALGAAAAFAAGKILIYGVQQSDANRQAELAQEAFEAMHPELRAVSDSFDELSRASTVTAPRLRELALALNDAGVSASDLPAALRAAATAETALGQGGADEFVERLRAGKLTVNEFAASVQRNLGGIAARQMLSLESLSNRLQDNLSDTFSFANIEPALGGLNRLVDLFDSSTESGRAMQSTFQGIFQPIIDQAETAAYVVEAFVIGFLIGLTKLYIQLKPAADAVAEFFGFESPTLTETLGAARMAGEALVPAFMIVAAAVGIVVAAFGALIAAMLVFPAMAFIASQVFVGWAIAVKHAVIDAVSAFPEVVTAVSDMVAQVATFLQSMIAPAAEIGTNIMTSMASAITGGAGVVVNAVSSAMRSAVAAAKSALGIASPSKEFRALADNVTGTYEDRIAAGSPGMQDAMADAVDPSGLSPELPATGLESLKNGSLASANSGETARAVAAAPSLTVSISGNTFTFHGVQGPSDGERVLHEATEEVLTRFLEENAAKLGAIAA